MSSKRSKTYCIASYTHLLNGKHTNLGGPAQHLAKYLGKKAYCIWQPIPIGKPIWVYAILKLRDIWLVLTRHKPADVFVGVEAINSLLGRLLGYKRVIYWNLDYSPTRGLIWGFFDRLAIRLADEIWVLKDRGLPKQKVVPIGCWYNEIKRLPLNKIDKVGIVYIGLLEDMQGVGILLDELADPKWGWHLTLIGTGKDEEKYKKKYGNYKNVKFTGVISDEEAQEIMCKNSYGWAVYHPDNPTIKTTLPTKPITYASCGLIVVKGLEKEDFGPQMYLHQSYFRKKTLAYARRHDWNRIFKEVLNG